MSKDLGAIAFFTSELARAGAAVVVTSLTPKREDQYQFLQTVLHGAGTGANVFHIHVATPLEHAEATDRRKVYARARRGELSGLPGVGGVEYETPEKPDLLVDVTAQGIPEIVHSEFTPSHVNWIPTRDFPFLTFLGPPFFLIQVLFSCWKRPPSCKLFFCACIYIQG